MATSYRTSYRTELGSESSGGESPRFRRHLLLDVGHEVLTPPQPANARVLFQGPSGVRAAYRADLRGHLPDSRPIRQWLQRVATSEL